MSKRYCPRCGGKLEIHNDECRRTTVGCCLVCQWIGNCDAFLTEPRPIWQPYVSIDLETTGLDPNECQILEFGAVIDDWQTPIKNLPQFQYYIEPEEKIGGKPRIVGQPYALALNAAIIKKIASPGPEDRLCYPSALGIEFGTWLQQHHIDPKHITAAGKNFASFDLQFLLRVPDFTTHINFKHRCIDPSLFFWNPHTDAVLPSTAECLKRAGFNDYVAHNAIEDCISVIELIRSGTKKCNLYPTALVTPIRSNT